MCTYCSKGFPTIGQHHREDGSPIYLCEDCLARWFPSKQEDLNWLKHNKIGRVSV